VDGNTAMANDSATVEETITGIGFTATYALGGGAALQFGFGSSETETDYTYGSALSDYAADDSTEHDSSTDTNSWSLGLKFKF